MRSIARRSHTRKLLQLRHWRQTRSLYSVDDHYRMLEELRADMEEVMGFRPDLDAEAVTQLALRNGIVEVDAAWPDAACAPIEQLNYADGQRKREPPKRPKNAPARHDRTGTKRKVLLRAISEQARYWR